MYGWGDDEGRTTTMMMARSVQGQGQWGQEETKEFIKIRTELERDSALTNRSKVLWDAVSSKMSERGFIRTSDQCKCKCKWKNLLNRYKGQETSDPENGRQCPFFEELHALFAEREKNMQRLLLETEMGSPRSRKKMKGSSNAGQSSDEFSENEENDKEGTDEETPTPPTATTTASTRRKRKAEKIAPNAAAASVNSETDIREMLKQFFEQQQTIEKQWMEMMDRRAYEQQLFEQEWRQSMEKLERERLMIEQSWREREEQRKIREESRAEKRDALLTTLLKNLLHENNL
ncbi:trihelix transcription factor GT-3b-like [Humulus lupulus]|uniref:trihelix transcription factor GT-3b-like n=1 Tax=Humulus lupulus TaxID=3486 RepID=UPI002B40B86B|nr:trihelix transcription factor GT-3b-like [Humulus lupulus]